MSLFNSGQQTLVFNYNLEKKYIHKVCLKYYFLLSQVPLSVILFCTIYTCV